MSQQFQTLSQQWLFIDPSASRPVPVNPENLLPLTAYTIYLVVQHPDAFGTIGHRYGNQQRLRHRPARCHRGDDRCHRAACLCGHRGHGDHLLHLHDRTGRAWLAGCGDRAGRRLHFAQHHGQHRALRRALHRVIRRLWRRIGRDHGAAPDRNRAGKRRCAAAGGPGFLEPAARALGHAVAAGYRLRVPGWRRCQRSI